MYTNLQQQQQQNCGKDSSCSAKTVLVRFRWPGTEANKNCLCRTHFFFKQFVYMYVTTYSHNIQSTPDKMKVPGDSERLALIRRCSSSNDAHPAQPWAKLPICNLDLMPDETAVESK